ncbi:SCP2 sterol-binding domain-containing protein [Streptomyces sp. ICBB 8177]|uniref:SCP2 sterol-binding domain-containing protein n=1 Tax=Streptomyces sp. ICBB 8177 TaxID=563922 RepID=UPI000D6725C9|nr:SCP2 sterol-binding domain-containing protein [Streptomyces sp. ICBB 8177]PWI41788.1 sterol-binding protein [Streptomyces sp. ICBB 8177]
MATIEECRSALDRLSHNLAGADGKVARAAAVDRSVSCAITDLGVTFTGRLSDGAIRDIVPVRGTPAERADIRLAMSGDDLVALVDGRLNFAVSWATGRVKLEAGLRDLLRLRTLL